MGRLSGREIELQPIPVHGADIFMGQISQEIRLNYNSKTNFDILISHCIYAKLAVVAICLLF